MGDPYRTFQVNTLLVAAFLEVIKDHCPESRFYQASSSEIVGDPPESPQTENTPHNPMTPYGVSKLAAHQLVGLYRRMHKVFAVSGILYNHESPRRPERFVTQKIARGAAEISRGRYEKLRLGNIDARRDWGFAGDFVRGIWSMLQVETPNDYILATGKAHSIRDFLELAFRHVGLDWKDWVDKARSVIRDVVRVMGLPFAEGDRIAKLVPEPVQGKTPPLKECIESEPRLRELHEKPSVISQWVDANGVQNTVTTRDLLDIGMALEGLNRQAGLHAAGVVIADRPLWEYVPTYKDDKSDMLVSQFAKDEVEAAGLVKFDFLGLKTLTVIDDALRLVRANHPERRDLAAKDIPLDEPAVYELIGRGDTANAF